MIDVRAANDRETTEWFDGWRQRILTWYGSCRASDAWIAGEVQRRLTIPDGAVWATHVLAVGDAQVGFMTTRLAPYGPATIAGIVDIWVEPARRRQGIGTAARQWAEDWARSQRRPLLLATDPRNEAAEALFRTYPVRFQSMLKPLGPVAAPADGLVPRPMREPELDRLLDAAMRSFAASTADSGLLGPDDAKGRARAQFGPQLSSGLSTEGNSFWTLDLGPDPVASIWLRHSTPAETSFVCYVQVDEAFRGRGLGRAAMQFAERVSVEAGDTYLGLSVFGANTVAVNLYTRLGYATVEQGRSVGAA
ncbi:MAG TPA: GNAT family N-acetyltransferase [Micromonosporaceae bacterium]|jgi:GNAT superfamily N-acetyltransferase